MKGAQRNTRRAIGKAVAVQSAKGSALGRLTQPFISANMYTLARNLALTLILTHTLNPTPTETLTQAPAPAPAPTIGSIGRVTTEAMQQYEYRETPVAVKAPTFEQLIYRQGRVQRTRRHNVDLLRHIFVRLRVCRLSIAAHLHISDDVDVARGCLRMLGAFSEITERVQAWQLVPVEYGRTFHGQQTIQKRAAPPQTEPYEQQIWQDCP